VRGVRFLPTRPSLDVTSRRRELELLVERPAGAGGSVARLSVRFEPGPNGTGPTPAELKDALGELIDGLDAAVGTPATDRPDRELTELIETYRPRQRELVDLLLADGEITPAEHQRLVGHLGTLPGTPRSSPPAVPVPDHPIAAAPVATESSLPAARPIAELLRTYQIESLKQAGAVRARRQISFAEYMALKRHFETAERSGSGPGGTP